MRPTLCLFAAVVAASGHPMGNFSVNRLATFVPDDRGVALTYTVELAEQPAFDLLRAWKIDANSPELKARAADTIRDWMGHWRLRPIAHPELEEWSASVTSGSGGLPVLRITARVRIAPPQHWLEFDDLNFLQVPGWREIVIRPGPGMALVRVSHSDRDRSRELTAFPAPAPHDSRARLAWTAEPARSAPVVQAIAQPAVPGTVVAAESGTGLPASRHDYLSELLGRPDLGLGVMVAGLAVAFAFGAMHALSPGHGKTIVAAYLVGARGTLRHAFLLGGMVTFTHTASVFLLGLGTLFLSNYVVPDRIYPILGAVSGLSIVVVGACLLSKRVRHALDHRYNRPHHHHDHEHPRHDHHGHEHHNHTHAHYVDGDVTVGSLIALGASGGLVPCPSALVLLLSSIALGRVGIGMVLLVSFSFGLATVLIAIGAAVLFAKKWLPQADNAIRHPAFRYIPVLSAAVIVCVGLVMTAVSLGWLRPAQGS